MNIRKYITYIGLTLSILFNTSCSLDEKWYSSVTPEIYYQSKEAVIGALGRPFTHWIWYTQQNRSFYLQEYGSDVICLPTRGTDWYNGGAYQRRHHHEWTVNEDDIWIAWRGIGQGVSYIMEVSEDLNNVNYDALGFSAGTKEDHLSQLKTLQAYFYWRGLDYFGGIPIYYNINEKDNKPRNTDQETFNHIEKLLLEAIPLIKPKETLGQKEDGFISQAAAAALLARLYFNAESYIGTPMYDKAEKICDDIIKGEYGNYDLDKTWYGPHSFENDKSPEMIWVTPSEPGYQQFEWWYKHFGHYETYKYLDLEVKGNNGGCLTPSLKPDGTPYTFKLGRPFAKFNDNDLRKKPYVYLGKKKYEGMFLMGEQKNPLTGSESKGNREYKNKSLTLVDYIGRMSEVGTDKKYASASDLPSTIADAEENSGIRPWKVPMPNMADVAYRWEPDNPIIRIICKLNVK